MAWLWLRGLASLHLQTPARLRWRNDHGIWLVSYDDPRLNALSFALLAPNPHNLQPWKVALEGESTLILMHDETRRLPHTDPFDRQIMIGMGCFLEQMVLAAGAEGYGVDITLSPQGNDAGRVAQAVFRAGATADPLAAHILARRSCKAPFAQTPVPAQMLAELSSIADVYAEAPQVAAVKELTWQAWLTETLTPHTMQESVDLMRLGKAEINTTPDGIDLGGPFLESLMAVGLLSREALADTDSTSFQDRALRICIRKMLFATPAYAALTSATATPARITSRRGGKWLRLNLQTTAMGLSPHPVSQALQEYPEMAGSLCHRPRAAGPRRAIRFKCWGGWGMVRDIPRTPRWPLEAKLTRG